MEEQTVQLPKEAKEIIMALSSIRARMQGLTKKRPWDDQFCDRLRVSLQAPRMTDVLARLSDLLQSPMKDLPQETALYLTHLLNDEPSNKRAAQWVRENAQLVGLLACLAAKENSTYLSEIELTEEPLILQETSSICEHIWTSRYDIEIDVKLNSPLNHGADTKWGNNTLFRRMRFFNEDGQPVEAPFYSANAIRGQIRDLLADDFLSLLGYDIASVEGILTDWFYHLLYCGGALTEARGSTKKVVGNIQRTNLDGVRQLRQTLPFVSLFGGAIGDRILPGRVQFYDLRPECLEWGNGQVPAAELFDWTFLTRREDAEEHETHSGMIANTEVLKAGVALHGGVTVTPMINDLELSCLYRGLRLFAARSLLGGQNARGLGQCSIEVSGIGDVETDYREYIQSERDMIIDYLTDIDALIKGPIQGELL